MGFHGIVGWNVKALETNRQTMGMSETGNEDEGECWYCTFIGSYGDPDLISLVLVTKVALATAESTIPQLNQLENHAHRFKERRQSSMLDPLIPLRGPCGEAKRDERVKRAKMGDTSEKVPLDLPG